MLELCAGHALAMQCGARASRFLDRAAAAGWDERANLEALRMAGLTARLMEGVQRLVPRVRASAVAGSAPALASRPADAAPAGRPARPPVPKRHAAPGQRRGCLKNGNPSGDYLQAPRCGARTRAGCPCRQPAMANGRCRMHGGLSTGPRTPEGLARSRTARLTHGYRTAELIGLRRRAAHAARRLRSLNRALSAGHGVDRSDFASASGGAAPCGRPSSPTVTPRQGAHARAPLRKIVIGSTVAAGHGVDRSDFASTSVGAAPCGRPLAATVARKPGAHAGAPLRKIVIGGIVAAGHGLHRSFRERLRSSAAGAA
jgi:hypothetical protein